jgi:hypothetical protein
MYPQLPHPTSHADQSEISTLDSTAFEIVQEYCILSKLENPSERDLGRITAILELAQFDPGLSCLINEADHLIAYELGICEAHPGMNYRTAAPLQN